MKSIERVLKKYNFTANRPIALTDTPCFSGHIDINGWKTLLELRFMHGKYNYPKAYLPEWPHNEDLRKALGYRHINGNGQVCYVDTSRIWWDSAEAPRLVVGCLERIIKLLNDNLSGLPSENIITRDFVGYWDASKEIFVGSTIRNESVYGQVAGPSGLQWIFDITHDDVYITIDEKSSCFTPWVTVHLKTPAAKLNTDVWPPENLKDICAWLDINDKNHVSKLISSLRKTVFTRGKGSQNNYSKTVGIIFTWPYDNIQEHLGCGFKLKFPELAAQEISHNRLKKSLSVIRSSNEPIERFSLNRADPSYIQNRNTPNVKTHLKNKKVVLIGGGTIGGYLAKLLCSHSAGLGPRGKLIIVDPDIFSVENIGRHFLSAASIGINKAEALEINLKIAFPYLSIESYPGYICNNWRLIDNHSIVIDATGSQTASISITDYLSEKKLTPLVIHSWIHGHGGATVAFSSNRSDKKCACYRCLWNIRNDSYVPLYQLSKQPENDEPILVGCHQSFHPYSTTVSMSAATQAINLLNDILDGNDSSTLRFNIIDHDLCQNRKDAKPEKSKSCPLCQRQ